MGKRILSLYTEDVLINQAKAMGINLSAFFNSAIELEMGIKKHKDNKDAMLDDLRLINIRLSESNRALKKENDSLKAEIVKKDKKNEPKVLKSSVEEW